jgi:hypothetical protein
VYDRMSGSRKEMEKRQEDKVRRKDKKTRQEEKVRIEVNMQYICIPHLMGSSKSL